MDDIGVCQAGRSRSGTRSLSRYGLPRILGGSTSTTVLSRPAHGSLALRPVIDAATFSENLVVGLQALGGAFFRSSVIFLPFPQESEREGEIQSIVRNAKRYDLGALLFHGEKLKETEGQMVHLIIDSVVELARIPNVQSRLAHSKKELRPDRKESFVTLRSIQKDLDFEALRETIEIVQTPCLFVMDSGLENALI